MAKKKRARSGSSISKMDAPTETLGVSRMGDMLSDNHPRLVEMAREMAGFIATRNPAPNDKGCLEIEVSFGAGAHTNFEPKIDDVSAQMILTACDRGMVEWTSREDEWHIYYDTYVRLPVSADTVRVRSIDGKENRNITKTLVARLDLATTAGDNLTMRMQAKIERDVICAPRNRVLLVPSESVRVSIRRSFCADSSTLRGLTYRYTIIKSWHGCTAKEAEVKMRDRVDGCNSVEIEAELPWPVMDHGTLVYACLAILMKGQDVIALLSGDRGLRKLRFTGYNELGKGMMLRRRKGYRRVAKSQSANQLGVTSTD